MKKIQLSLLIKKVKPLFMYYLNVLKGARSQPKLQYNNRVAESIEMAFTLYDIIRLIIL